MRTYIGLRYLAHASVVAVAMALVTLVLPMPDSQMMMPAGEAAAKALFWSIPIAVWLTHRDLARKNVWPLVDNLRVHRVSALAVPASVQLLLWAALAVVAA